MSTRPLQIFKTPTSTFFVIMSAAFRPVSILHIFKQYQEYGIDMLVMPLADLNAMSH